MTGNSSTAAKTSSFALAAPVLLGAHSAIAAGPATDLGDVFNTAQSQLQWITGILGIVFFVLGAWLIVSGITTLKDAVESQGTQVKYSHGFLKLAGGGFITSIDFLLIVGTEALTGASAWIQPSFTVADLAAVQDKGFIGMAANFATNAAGPLTLLVAGVCVVIGIILVASAVIGMTKQGTPQARETAGQITAKFIAGICLVNSFWMINLLSETLGLGGPMNGGWDGVNSLLSYGGGNSGNAATDYASKIVGLAFIALIPFGLIAFARGILIIKNSLGGNQQASIGSGATHMIGGVALVNAHAAACLAITTFVSSDGIPGWC